MKPEKREKHCSIKQLHAEFQAIPPIFGSPGMTMPTQKKFSTTRYSIVATLLGLAFIAPVLAQTRQATASMPAAPASRTPAGEAAGEVFVPDAPDRHVVVKGDTLWDIAGKYLRQPWLWPRIWQMNRDQINNPHWIYPGQVIVLDRTNGTMRVATVPAPAPGDNQPTVTLRPSIRAEIESQAIPSIPPEAIEPFLTQPVLVETATMNTSPRLVGSRERVLLGRGDEVYASGILDAEITNYMVYRPGSALRDPDNKAILGYEAVYLGTARVVRKGDPQTLLITSSKLEIGVGDRLLPVTSGLPNNYAPRAPEQNVSGRIVSIYGGVAQAGRNQVVALNRGSGHGLQPGHVLAMTSDGRTITDRSNGPPVSIKLPDERNGLIFVFRVFDKVSYALVMNVTVPVSIGDRFTQP